jgi:hypothetical protein
MADAFGAFAVGQEAVQAQPVLLTEALLYLGHGLGRVEQPDRTALGRHAAVDERQVVGEADDARWVV